MSKIKRTGNGEKPAPSNSTTAEPQNRSDKFDYFLSLEIEEVRCFSMKQTLDLSDGKGRPARWTVLLGENGTGKTTLLQILALFERAPESTPERNSDLSEERIKLGPTSRPSRLFHSGSSRMQSYFRNSQSKKTITWTAKVRAIEGLAGELTSELLDHSLRLTRINDGFAGVVSFWSLPNTKVFGYGAGRRLSNSTMSSDAVDDPVNSLFSECANLRNAEDWLLQLDYSAKSANSIKDKATQEKRLKQVTQLLVSILPNVESIRFGSEIGANPKASVEFQTPYGWVGLRGLGYGYQTLIAWVTDLVSRMVETYPNSADPLAEPAIVLVDEIDLHLHPRWQRDIISLLSDRFPNTQFIVTAHSPLIVQGGPDVNLAVLKRVGDHVEIKNDVDEIRNWRVDQILTSDLFGIPSARPKHFEQLQAEKANLLAIKNRNEKQNQRLASIQEELEGMPLGDSPTEQKALDTLQKALKLLQK